MRCENTVTRGRGRLPKKIARPKGGVGPTNWEKSQAVGALSGRFALADLLAAAELARSSHCCSLAHPPSPTRAGLWDKAREVFSRTPNGCGHRQVAMAQQQEMLDMLLAAMPEGARPVMHSDMGWQHQNDRYVSRLREAGITQSMSRKGNCLDNATTEQVFGHLKDEFFRGGQWPDFASFKRDLEAYIVHWNTRRRQKRLKGLTPEEFRNSPLWCNLI